MDTLDRIEIALQTVKKIAFKQEITYLGMGREGVVFTDFFKVYKIFDGWETMSEFDNWQEMFGMDFNSIKNSIIDRIRMLCENHSKTPFSWLPNKMEMICFSGIYFLRYEYVYSTPYTGGFSSNIVQMIKDLCGLQMMYGGFKPDSFRMFSNQLKLVDIGYDLRPFLKKAICHNLQRAFLMMYWADHPNLRHLQRASKNDSSLPELSGFYKFLEQFGDII
ncbi:MAG: hypothetical protein HUU50_00345 [Candidatus Brocadiae bacterium]|nr:hypothetical protein [Candidatus Brocadiia bacterium]